MRSTDHVHVRQIYRYEEGSVAFVGVGHSTDITNIKLSPDQRHLVSVSADGAIFMWGFPNAVEKEE